MRTRLSRAEQVERNRELVLDAARRVFLDRGYSGASLDAIAEEAGFSKGVVYSQFASKADLFLALLDRRIAERAEENERIAATRSGFDGVRALLAAAERDQATEHGWIGVLLEFRSVALHDPDLNRRYAERHAHTVERFAEVLQGVLDRGGVTPAVPARTMAQMILAIGSGLVLERAADASALPGRALNQMLRAAFGLTGPDDRKGSRR